MPQILEAAVDADPVTGNGENPWTSGIRHFNGGMVYDGDIASKAEIIEAVNSTDRRGRPPY